MALFNYAVTKMWLYTILLVMITGQFGSPPEAPAKTRNLPALTSEGSGASPR
jgi:hypothetical protein